MLLAYDNDGTVIYQLGVNSLMPEGPPEGVLPALFDEAGISPEGWVRLHDDDDAEVVEQVLARGARIVDGKVKVLPEPEPAPELAPTATPPMTGDDMRRDVDLLLQLVLTSQDGEANDVASLAPTLRGMAERSSLTTAAVDGAFGWGVITSDERAELLEVAQSPSPPTEHDPDDLDDEPEEDEPT